MSRWRREYRWKAAARSAVTAVVGVPTIRRTLRVLSLRGLLPRAVWQRLPVTGPWFDVPVGKTSFRYAVVPGDHLARALFWRGLMCDEAESLEVFQTLASRSMVFVDVGANTGVYTLTACATSPYVQVEAFEAVPRIREILHRNIALNGWEDRCRVHELALTDREGDVEFIVPDMDLPTSAHLATAQYRSQAGERITVRGARLDDVLIRRVDLVKVDVEGAEDAVLKGMDRILGNDHPTLLIECLPEGPYAAVERILQSFNYRFQHLTVRGPVAVPRLIPDPQRKERNFLCLPPGADRGVSVTAA